MIWEEHNGSHSNVNHRDSSPLHRRRGRRARRMSRSSLSNFLNKGETWIGGSLWSLLFLSDQMMEIKAWAERRVKVLDELCGGSRHHRIRLFQSRIVLEGWPRRWRSILHSWEENVHCNRRWSLVSTCWPHRQHEGSIVAFHRARRALTGKRSKWQIQRRNACFGTADLNQTACCQLISGAFGRSCSQVFLIEKDGDLDPAGPHENSSSIADSEGGCMSKRDSRRQAMAGVLQRGEGRIHPVWRQPSATFALILIPILLGPESPMKVIRGPWTHQLSHQ